MKSFLFYHATSQASVVIITIALMLFTGYLMTRITRKFKLPNVTGYILAGILMGPYCLDMVPVKVIDGMDFLSDIALAFIAFSTGEFFRFSVLKKNGWKVVVITVMEAVLASVCVFAVVYGVLHLNLPFSIVLAALASATAPASTIMTIRQTGAKGDFVDTHVHPTMDEHYYFMEGEGLMMIVNEKYICKAGTYLLIPAGYRHSLQACSEMKFITIGVAL